MRALLLAALCAGAAQAAPGSGRPPTGKELAARAHQLFLAGRYADVIAALPAAAMQKLRGKSLRLASFCLAKSYARTRQIDKALSVFQLGHKLFPDDIEILTGLAQLFESSRMEEQAQPLYDRVLALEPNNVGAHLGLAAIDQKLGLLDRSARHYEFALELSSGDAAVWRDYAEVLYKQRDFTTAEPAILKSLELSPHVLDSQLDLAFIQRAQGRLKDALETIEGVIALTGREADLLLAYSLWLLEAGEVLKSRTIAEEVLARHPDQALADWILARIDIQAGQRASASRRLESASEKARRGFIAEASETLLKELTR